MGKKLIISVLCLFIFNGCMKGQKEKNIFSFKEEDYPIFSNFNELELRKLNIAFDVILFLKSAEKNPYFGDPKQNIFRGGVGTISYKIDWGRPDKKYLNVDTSTSEFRPLFYETKFSDAGVDIKIFSRDYIAHSEQEAEKESRYNSFYRYYRGFIKREDFLKILKRFIIGDIFNRGIQDHLYIMQIISETKEPPEGVIICKGGFLVDEPNENQMVANKIISQLSENERVKIFVRTRDKIFNKNDEFDFWYLVKRKTGEEGWVFAPFIKPDLGWE